MWDCFVEYIDDLRQIVTVCGERGIVFGPSPSSTSAVNVNTVSTTVTTPSANSVSTSVSPVPLFLECLRRRWGLSLGASRQILRKLGFSTTSGATAAALASISLSEAADTVIRAANDEEAAEVLDDIQNYGDAEADQASAPDLTTMSDLLERYGNSLLLENEEVRRELLSQ